MPSRSKADALTAALEAVAVVGASLAGLRAVEALRRDGYEGRLVWIGDEPHHPYDRPPLSKELLAGGVEPDGIALRRLPYEDLAIDWRLGRRAIALDAPAREITLDDGEHLRMDGIIVATGASPRVLPDVAPLDGVFTLRTLDDALAIRSAVETSARVVVVGAGFIGAEVAATCRTRGLQVTLLEALPVPLVRGLGPVMGDACGDLHRDHGVDLRTSTAVAGIEGEGRVERVRLVDGSAIDADVLIVGVGVAPNTAWLEGSGLTIDNGVVCDETCLAAPGIVAAGDVARWPNPLFDGELMRLEHWTNASEMGVAAARRLLAGDVGEPFAPVPFFWSDQYDVKLQFVGRSGADDELAVVHGSVEERRFVALYGRAGRLIGALGFSRPRQLMQYRRMIAERATFAHALAAARDAD